MAGRVSRLMYVSTAKPHVEKSDIEDILEAARLNNAARDVTGMLLHDSCSFLQLLEGRADAVSQTFDAICNDDRHENIVVVLRERDIDRQFPSWSMGYALLQDPRILRGNGWFPLTPFQLENALPEQLDPNIRLLFTSFLSVTQPEPA